MWGPLLLILKRRGVNFAKFHFHSPGAHAALAVEGSYWLETNCLARPCQDWYRRARVPIPRAWLPTRMTSAQSLEPSILLIVLWPCDTFNLLTESFLKSYCLLVLCPELESPDFSLRIGGLVEPDLNMSPRPGPE